MTLYPRNQTTTLDEALFRQPTAEYRGTPFWAWNSRLDTDQLARQIAQFERMGYGGFHMHSRTGLETPYLGEEYLKAIRTCTEDAHRRKMLAWLYDEDRWPSGFAGGLVTKDPTHRLKYLLFTRTPYNGTIRPTPNWGCAMAGRLENGTLLARYAVKRDEQGAVRYQKLAEDQAAPEGMEEWFAYLETADGVPWYNHQGFVDSLSPAAIQRFVEVTHERYKECVGEFFGTTIPAIFTDEPQHLYKGCLTEAEQGVDVTLPATTDFFETFQQRYGTDLLDALPELYWELPNGQPSLARYRYHDHVTERFSQAYAGTLGRWCAENGIHLMGHMMEEPTLFTQTHATGEVMRSLAHFQIPGVDMLCDETEYTTVKQAQSVAHQFGRPGVMSELYGVTGWSFDFVGHKSQGDWQAALGVTVRVPHLAWLSMAGEAKRDYPASIHYQSPWWEEYRLIEDHFARINVAMSRGKPLIRIGVLHPIESYWLCYGPETETKQERARQEQQFAELPQWLLGNLLDFNYICESILPGQSAGDTGDRGFTVGEMTYDTLVVPPMRTIRASTLDRLEAFVDAGGAVIFAGEVPALVNAEPSSRPAELAKRATRCAWSETALVEQLADYRLLDCVDPQGARYTGLLYQLRQDGENRQLFLCHRDREKNAGPCSLRIHGQWKVFGRDTLTGESQELPATVEGATTVLPLDVEAHAHWLLTLKPGTPAAQPKAPAVWKDVGALDGPVPVTLSEPNVLILNQAEWRWNGGEWQPNEEILRLHNRIRVQCGLAEREGHVVQPWADHDPVEPLGRVDLRFIINSEIAVEAPELAVEAPNEWTITLDGKPVEARSVGWWVDEAIHRIALPAISAGRHELVLSRTFTRKTDLEWAYLLGDFGVRLEGRHGTLIEPVKALVIGDWTTQGLPFYAGNLTYHFELDQEAQATEAIHFSGFKAPLLSVVYGDQAAQPVAFAPFRFALPAGAGTGTVRLDVTAFGNRHNAFGPIHNTQEYIRWLGPDSWRSTGKLWSYDYHLKPMGLLQAPRLQSQ